MVHKTTIQTIRKYGHSLIIPITKQAKELDLKVGDVALVTIDNGLNVDTPLSFDGYVSSVLEDSKRFAKTQGLLFLNITDCFWQTPEIIKGFVEKRIKKNRAAQKNIRLS